MEEMHAANPNLFKAELDEAVGRHDPMPPSVGRDVPGAPTSSGSNRKYFVYKSIILRNLYGVDIMHEATEIARLRLFLKMVAVVDVDRRDPNLGLDPLPDIDFNIRCGNTLVGYATEKEIQDGLVNGDMFAYVELKKKIEDEMGKAATAFDYFRREQLNLLGSHADLVKAKRDINKRLAAIRELLDRQLYATNGGGKPYDEWQRDTQPFHWYTEFYPVMAKRGGFDVIIGNPPYVAMSKIDYLKKDESFRCPNLYGHVIRRVYGLLRPQGHHGFVVMHNLAFSSDFKDTRKVIFEHSTSRHFSFYSRIPSGLFSGDCRVRNAIYMTSSGTENRSFTTRLHRWYAEQRETLLQNISYGEFDLGDVIPMSEYPALLSAMQPTEGKYMNEIISSDYSHDLYFKKLAYNFLSISEKEAPCTYPNGKTAPQTTVYRVGVDSSLHRDLLLLLFSGKFYFSKWCVFGDDLNYTKGELLDFRFPIDRLTDADLAELKKLSKEIKRRAAGTIQFKLNAGKNVGTYNTSKLWDITDKSDAIFLKYICTNPVEVQEQLFTFVSQMTVALKKGEDGDGNDEEGE